MTESDLRRLAKHYPGARRWLLDGPRSLRRWPVWLLDEILDRVPCREDGAWYRNGGWGCRLRLNRWWL